LRFASTTEIEQKYTHPVNGVCREVRRIATPHAHSATRTCAAAAAVRQAAKNDAVLEKVLATADVSHVFTEKANDQCASVDARKNNRDC